MKYKRGTISWGTFFYIDNDDMLLEITITKKSRGKYLIDIYLRPHNDPHLHSMNKEYEHSGSMVGMIKKAKEYSNIILESNNLKVV